MVVKNDKLSYLPQDGLLALARGDSAIVREIVAEIKDGNQPTATEIKRRIKAAQPKAPRVERKRNAAPPAESPPLDRIKFEVAKLDLPQLEELLSWLEECRAKHSEGSDAEAATLIDAHREWVPPLEHRLQSSSTRQELSSNKPPPSPNQLWQMCGPNPLGLVTRLTGNAVTQAVKNRGVVSRQATLPMRRRRLRWSRKE